PEVDRLQEQELWFCFRAIQKPAPDGCSKRHPELEVRIRPEGVGLIVQELHMRHSGKDRQAVVAALRERRIGALSLRAQMRGVERFEHGSLSLGCRCSGFDSNAELAPIGEAC